MSEFDGFTRYQHGERVRCPKPVGFAPERDRRALQRCGRSLPQRCGPDTSVWVRVKPPGPPEPCPWPTTLEACPRCGSVLELRYVRDESRQEAA